MIFANLIHLGFVYIYYNNQFLKTSQYLVRIEPSPWFTLHNKRIQFDLPALFIKKYQEILLIAID